MGFIPLTQEKPIGFIPLETEESLLKSTAKGFAKGGATFMPKSFWGGVKVLKDVANQYPAFIPWAAGTQLIPEGYPEKQIAEVEKTAEYLTPEERKGWTQYIPKAAETLGQMAGSAVSTAGVGTLPAMAVGAGINRTLQTQKEGESLPKALLAGGMSGVAEYATEKLPIKYLTQIGLPYLKRLAGGLISDVPGEIYETFIEMKSIDEGLLGKKYTPQEYAKAILDTAATSAITTGVATTAVQPFRQSPPSMPEYASTDEASEAPPPPTRPPRDLLAGQIKIPQIQQTQKQEVVLPLDKPIEPQPKGFTPLEEQPKPSEIVPRENAKILTFEELPNYAKGAIASEVRVKATNAKIEIPYKDIASKKFIEKGIFIEDIQKTNPDIFSDNFVKRGSVTKGRIVIDGNGKVIDGNNRIREAFERGESKIDAFIEIGQPEIVPRGEAAPIVSGEEYIPVKYELVNGIIRKVEGTGKYLSIENATSSEIKNLSDKLLQETTKARKAQLSLQEKTPKKILNKPDSAEAAEYLKRYNEAARFIREGEYYLVSHLEKYGFKNLEEFNTKGPSFLEDLFNKAKKREAAHTMPSGEVMPGTEHVLKKLAQQPLLEGQKTDIVPKIVNEPQPKGFTPLEGQPKPSEIVPRGTVKATGEAASVVSKEPWQISVNEIKTEDISENNPIHTVGYRYGFAPESEKSWNYREGRQEKGSSMASAAGLSEVRSFAVTDYASKRQKIYYEGDIIGYGGDDEPLMINVEKISKNEYENKIGAMPQLQLLAKKLNTAKILANKGYSGYEAEVLKREKLLKEAHKTIIQQALSEGKPVPSEVLKDYPELQTTHIMPSGEVMPITQTEAKSIIAQSQQDYSPKAIKQHKKYLFEQIDEAIKNSKEHDVSPVSIPLNNYKEAEAETTAKLKAAGDAVGFVTIEVPGDGKFRIINSKQSLTKFKNDVVAKFPTTKISNTQKIEKAPMGIVADKAIGIYDAMEGTYNKQSIHGNGEMLLFTPLKIKPKSYRTTPDGDRVALSSRIIDDLIDKEKPHYNVDDVIFFVQKTDEAKGISDIPLPHLKEDMAIAELYAGDKHTFISQKYYNYIKAHFPDATFKIADSDKVVQIYSNKKLVGLVMPLELPSHAPTKEFNPISETNLETFGFQSMYEAGEHLAKNVSDYVKTQREYKRILKEGGVTEDIPHDIGKFKQFISFPHTIAKRFPKTKVFQERTYQQVEQFENVVGDLKDSLDAYIKNHDTKVDKALIEGYISPTPKLFSDQELTARGFSQEEIQAYKAVAPTMKLAADVLEQHLIKVGKDPQEVQAWRANFQESYIPLSRFGKFYVSVKDGQGNGITTPTFDNVGQARKAVVDLRRQYPDARITMGNIKRLAPEAYEGMPLNVLAFLSQFDENLSANFASVIGKGFPGHLLQVKKTPGFETNLKKSLSDYVLSLARYVSINEYKRDITNMLDYEKSGIVDPKREAGLWGYWKRYSDYIISNPKEFAKFRQFFYYYYLGANIKSALLNATQPLTTTYPVLSKYAKQPAMLMAKAFKMAAHTQKGLTKINPELSYAVQSAIHDGTISEQNINELRGLRQGKTASKIGNALSFLFSSAEKYNRKVSFIAMYLAAREGYLKNQRPQSHAEMQKMAEDFVKETQYDYRKVDRPELARGWRAPLFTFRMFSGNYLSMLKNLMVEKEFAALARSLGVMLILGGVSAIPGWKELEKALQLMGYDPKKSFREYMGKEQGELALHGLPFTTGGNISGALGTIELLPGDIQQGVTAGIANLVLGVPTDIPKRFDRARQYLFKLNSPYRAVEAVMPEFVRNPMVAIRWIREEGIRSPKFEKLGTATNKDIFFKAIGIQPSNLTNIYEQKHSAIVIKNRVTRNAEEYNFRLARALYVNDIGEYKKTMDEIIGHNQKSKSELDLIIPDKSSVKRQVQGMYDSRIKDIKEMPKRGRRALMELGASYLTKPARELMITRLTNQPEDEDYGIRKDGTQKGRGYLGELKRPDNSISTELSIGVNFDGKEREIPSLVPTLSKSEIDFLLNGNKPTDEIIDKAITHAKMRISQGKSPFYGEK